MTPIELAYAAGLIDGEAYIGIKRTAAYRCQGRTTAGYHARIQVRMVDDAGLTHLADLLGGTLRREAAHAARGRPLHCWQLSDAAAESALRALLPYLRVKRAVAKKVLSLRRLQRRGHKHRTKITGYRNFPNQYGTARRIPNRSYSDQYVGWCERLYWDCRLMNGLARFVA